LKVIYTVTDDWYFLSHRLHIARAARDHGCEVVVVTEPGERSAEITAEGFRHRTLRFHRTLRSQPRNVALLAGLRRLYREERPDLVHHVSFLPIFVGTLAARSAKVPGIVNAVTGLGHAFMDGGLRRRVLRFSMERAYRTALAGGSGGKRLAIFQNDDDRRYFLARGLTRESSSVCISGSGVDTESFAPTEPDAAAPPIILHASRMLWSKGVGTTVEACRLLRRRGLPHRLVLAGRTHPTNPESIPEARLFGWQEEGVAEWVGHRDDMASLIAASQVVCLPTYYREGVPKVLLEAASSARPIITTDVPGCRDIVGNEENGFIVPPRDAERLADCLQVLMSDAALRERMGQAGREKVLAGFSKEIVVRHTLDCYRELVPDRWPKEIRPMPPARSRDPVST
jgi:glycosyltransferase involved in cell wall biosynthesis